MFTYSINLWPAIVAAVASNALGFLWYSPILFGKPWMAMMGITAEKMSMSKGSGSKNMGAIYGLNFVFDIATACILSFLLTATGNLTDALGVTFLIWLGFSAPILLGSVFWEEKPFKLFLINASFRLVSFLAMALVLSLF